MLAAALIIIEADASAVASLFFVDLPFDFAFSPAATYVPVDLFMTDLNDLFIMMCNPKSMPSFLTGNRFGTFQTGASIWLAPNPPGTVPEVTGGGGLTRKL
jgi:hypothetical protein